MSDTGMWKREGHESCLAQIATLRADLAKAREEVAEKEALIAAWNEIINAMGERCKAAERARDEARAALRPPGRIDMMDGFGMCAAPSSEAPARCPEPPYCDRCNSSGVTGCNCSGGTGTKGGGKP